MPAVLRAAAALALPERRQRAWRLGRQRGGGSGGGGSSVAAPAAAARGGAGASRRLRFGGAGRGGGSGGGSAGSGSGPEPFVFGVPPAAAAHFKKGINLGNRLEAPNEGDWGGIDSGRGLPVHRPARLRPRPDPDPVQRPCLGRVPLHHRRRLLQPGRHRLEPSGRRESRRRRGHARLRRARRRRRRASRSLRGALDADCGPLPESAGHGRVRAPQRTQQPARHHLE